jgi:secreted PhoX family phosphatase
MRPRTMMASLALVGLAGGAAVAGGRFALDFGLFRDKQLDNRANVLFGVNAGLPQSSTTSIDAATANADPRKLVTLAHGLHARVVSAATTLGANIDMMALWPDDQHPTHIIACNEGGTSDPGVQRIRLSDGAVETMVTGTSSCDPAHRTAWGTVVVGEENGTDGQVFEIINPLAVTNVLFDRVAGTFSNGPGGSGAENLAVRRGLGRLSFEGLAVYPNGVTYYGDENRPGTGTAGGAYFKFIPATPFSGSSPITNLASSPLAAGSVYGLRLGLRSSGTDYGQGSNTGMGVWVPIPGADNVNLRAQAAALKLTGYYRPEDLEIDAGALAAGNVRACGNNTGNEGSDRNFGETICLNDGTLAAATANTATPEVQLLVVGTPEFAMMDNLAQQPGTGNFVIQEDGDGPEVGRNNDIWACLDDGGDDDLMSDGCIRIATLNDLTAESTGVVFDGSGNHMYVSIQHNITGHGVILDIVGLR